MVSELTAKARQEGVLFMRTFSRVCIIYGSSAVWNPVKCAGNRHKRRARAIF